MTMTPATLAQTPRPGNHRTLLMAVPLLLLAILPLDSKDFAARFGSGQWLANIITCGFFLWMLRGASPRLRRLMIIGVGVATAGEVIFSLLIGMYEYRLHNVPLYVPPGHAILYAAVFQFARDPWVIRHSTRIIMAFYTVTAIFSLTWLLAFQDVYGFICFVVFSALIFFRRDSRLFFVSMYLLVAYLELIGTYYQCWRWPPYLLNQWPGIPSANPPSGISVFYMGFDIGCLGFYKLSKLELRRRYKRFKSFRKAHSTLESGELAAAGFGTPQSRRPQAALAEEST